MIFIHGPTLCSSKLPTKNVALQEAEQKHAALQHEVTTTETQWQRDRDHTILLQQQLRECRKFPHPRTRFRRTTQGKADRRTELDALVANPYRSDTRTS